MSSGTDLKFFNLFLTGIVTPGHISIFSSFFLSDFFAGSIDLLFGNLTIYSILLTSLGFRTERASSLPQTIYVHIINASCLMTLFIYNFQLSMHAWHQPVKVSFLVSISDSEWSLLFFIVYSPLVLLSLGQQRFNRKGKSRFFFFF